jgi:hypothetical protein
MNGKCRRSSCRPHQTALAALYALDCFFLFDSPALSLGEVVVVAAQDRLYILLKVFAELAYLFLYAFFRFRLRAYQIIHLPFEEASLRGNKISGPELETLHGPEPK